MRAGSTASGGTRNGCLADHLRLLQIVDTIDVGGAGKVALQGLRALVRASVPVVSANFAYRGKHSRFSLIAGESGAIVFPLRQTGRLDYAFVEELETHARRTGVNVIETHSFKPHVVGWLLSRRLRVPWLAFAHGWTTEALRVRTYNAIEQRALLRCPDHVVAVAETIERRLREGGRSLPITVLHNGIEGSTAPVSPEDRSASRTKLGLADDAFVGVVVGRLSYEKAVDLLLDSVAAIAAAVPRLRIMIAGEGPERSALEAQSVKLGLTQVVRFVGYVTDVRPLLAAADVLLLPSRTEGLPNVALEALDAGVPVLSTRVGAMHDLLRDGVTGWLVPIEDAGAFGTQLASLAQLGSLRSFGLAGREDIQTRFSAEARFAKLSEVYGQLLLAQSAA